MPELYGVVVKIWSSNDLWKRDCLKDFLKMWFLKLIIHQKYINYGILLNLNFDMNYFVWK